MSDDKPYAMTFLDVMKTLLAGGRCTRASWGDSARWCGSTAFLLHGAKSLAGPPYFFVTSQTGLTPWAPSPVDMAAVDWTEVK